VKICALLYSFHSIWKIKFVRRVYRNVSNALIFMKIDPVQSIISISTERDLYAHLSSTPSCMILVKFVARRLHVMLLWIGGFYENWRRKAHVFLRMSRKLHVCVLWNRVALWKGRTPWYILYAISRNKIVQSCLKVTPTKGDWCISIHFVNVHGLYCNIFGDILVFVQLAVQ
jgi:hypothetical protein